ncbi:MAG: DUF2075 domain-containing protein [Erysipelotrichaceae bacterium]
MLVYQETKQMFLDDVVNDKIEVKIDRLVYEKLHKHTAESERRSWMNSMQYMYKVLVDPDIPNDCNVAIEYKIPNCNRRVDFIISGEDNKGKENAVIIELKQWDHVEKMDCSDGIIKTHLQGRLIEVTHPSYQAWSYASLIHDYNEDVRKYEINLEPCAYLHNYRLEENDDLIAECYNHYIEKAPVFTRGDVGKLRSFISKFINKGNGNVLYRIENGVIKPSKALQDNIGSMLRGNPEFTLIDEQKVVFERAISLAKMKDNQKHVYIIQGGPGTGKSVLAINMLSSILSLDQNIMYVTKNAAPRAVYQKMLTNDQYRKAQVDNLFKGSGSFTECDRDVFDCLVIDEAHRLNEKSGMFANLGENQIKELINSAKLSIFFVDDHQQVTMKDIGSTAEIMKWAKYYHAQVSIDKLVSQFRCNGSDGYLAWIDNVLAIEETENLTLDVDYDIQIIDDPTLIYNMIQDKNKLDNKARMLAGYCWDWISKKNADFKDVKIADTDFEMKWNFSKTNTWAIDSQSVNTIGCIHTSQGLEFDYVGVIIGDDLRYEHGQIVTDFSKRAKTDQSLKGIKQLYKRDPKQALDVADRIIKNTYRTLLTRGQKGCYIYCVDKGLAEYLKKSLNNKNKL